MSRTKQRFLREGIEVALREEPRSGQPKVHTAAREAEVIALACSDAPSGRTRWTLELLTERLNKQKGFKKINRESVRLIQKIECKPWLKKMWCIAEIGNKNCSKSDGRNRKQWRRSWRRFKMRKEVDPEIKIKWYLSYEILYFEYEDLKLQGDHLVWENLILLKADSPEEAYKKAVEHGKLSEGELRINERKGFCKFKGLKKLIPIYEEIEDGCEIEWREYETSKKELNKSVVSKKKLQAFLPLTEIKDE